MTLRRSRKGQTGEEDGGGFNLIVAGAAAVIILFIGVILYAKVFTTAKSEFDDNLCRTSIKTHSKLLYASAGEFATQIECTPRDIAINTDKEDKFYDAAEAMRFCYDRWNPDDRLRNGELELFSENGVYCNPCAFVTFTGDQGLDGFDEYLTTTNVSGTGLTYAEYFTPGFSEEALDNTPGDFATQTPSLAGYKEGVEGTVLFLYARGESVQKIKDNFNRNPTRNVKEIGNNAAWGAGGGLAAFGATLFIVGTGGAGAVVIGAVAVGSAVVGAVGGGALTYFFGSSERPEWVATVVMRPNEDETFKGFDCEYIEQQTAQLGPRDV